MQLWPNEHSSGRKQTWLRLKIVWLRKVGPAGYQPVPAVSMYQIGTGYQMNGPYWAELI